MVGRRCWTGPAPNGSQRRARVVRVEALSENLGNFPGVNGWLPPGLREDSVHTVPMHYVSESANISIPLSLD